MVKKIHKNLNLKKAEYLSTSLGNFEAYGTTIPKEL